ncbi:MAG: CpsB/CapC family capsule biosynthesis tyrosine phosphatase [Planctomycetota bacterium]
MSRCITDPADRPDSDASPTSRPVGRLLSPAEVGADWLVRSEAGGNLWSHTTHVAMSALRKGVRYAVLSPDFGLWNPMILLDSVRRLSDCWRQRDPESRLDLLAELPLGHDLFTQADQASRLLGGLHRRFVRIRMGAAGMTASNLDWLLPVLSRFRDRGQTPILCGLESCESMARCTHFVDAARSGGAWVQLPCRALVGRHGKAARRLCRKLIVSGRCDLIAGGQHGLASAVAFRHVQQWAGPRVAEQIFVRNAEQLLVGRKRRLETTAATPLRRMLSVVGA